MRLPRLPRLRTRRPPSAPSETGGRLKFTGGAVLVFLLFFAVGLYLFFPEAALRERIESEVAARSQLDLRMAGMELTFPPGLSATDVTATLEDLPVPPLQAERFELTPQWLSLAGDPGVDFHAELYRGWIDGSVRRSGALEARAGSITFSLPLMANSSMRAEGVLERAELETVLPVGAKDASRLRLGLEGVRVSGLEPLGLPGGALALGRIALAGDGTRQSFRIERMTATGGDIEVSGEGTIYVTDPPERSRLNLTVVLRPTPGLDRGVADLLQLVGQAGGDGSRRLRIAGTLARPVVR